MQAVITSRFGKHSSYRALRSIAPNSQISTQLALWMCCVHGRLGRNPMSWSLRYLLGCLLAVSPVLTGIAITSPTTNLEQTSPILTPTNSEAAYGVGYWIWAGQTLDKQTCRFWKTITIPRGAVVVEARVRTTADNSYRFYLDDQEVTQGSAWESMTECDLTAFMKPGVHVLAMEAFNDYSAAGALVAMRIELADGQVMKIGSDRSWHLVPLDDNGWRSKTKPEADWGPPRVLGPFGTPPWQRVGRILKLAPVQPVVLKFWQTGWFQISLLSVSVVAVLISLHLLNRLAVQSKAQEMLQVERARIARDFHDDLGARITQLVLLTEVARRGVPTNIETQPKLDQLCTRMRDLSGAIKEVVWVVNSQRDTLRDFVIYVCNYAEVFFASTATRCRFDVGEELPEVTFDLPTRRNLFLAVKEALNNAAKYSEATELVLRIHCDSKAVEVVVEDNGKGFVYPQNGVDHNGLANITQRMKGLGGDCRIVSQPGKGCRIELKMPFTHARPHRRWFGRWNNSRESSRAQTLQNRTEAA